jgi:signal transduction histidine kinase
VLSHELRTPLAPIVNVSMKLKQAANLPPEVRAAAEMITATPSSRRGSSTICST